MQIFIILSILTITASTTRGSLLKSSLAKFYRPVINACIATGVSLQFLASPFPSNADAIPTIGASAPDFTLPSNAGKSISLPDIKGKWTVLYFYPGDFTQGCTIEAQSFERDIDKYRQLNAQIYGVSVDSVEKHLDFGKTYNLDFTLLSDQGGAVSNKYGSLLDLGFIGKFSNRQTYIIDPELKVRYVFTDVEGRVAKHSQDVLTKLQELI